MTVHLVNPSHLSFGVGVITPRWLFVLAGGNAGIAWTAANHRRNPGAVRHRRRAARRRRRHRDPHRQRASRLRNRYGRREPGARRSSSAGSTPRCIHEEAHELGGAHAVVRGRRRRRSGRSSSTTRETARCKRSYEGGRVDADRFVPARWDLLPQGRYMWGSVQTVRGCPKHCSFCSVWRTDGQKPRQRARRQRRRRDRRAPSSGLPVRRAGRRQLLSGHAGRSRDGGASEKRGAARTAADAARRAIRADGEAGGAAVGHGVLHADHDGGGRGRGVPRRDAAGQHQGRAGRRRGGHARRAEGRLQGLQRCPARRWCSGCASSATTACTSSARSSSACRAIGPRPSTRRRTSPNAPASPSRSSSC